MGPESLSLPSVRSDVSANRRRVVDAVYADGVLRLVEPLALEDGSTVHITVLPAGQPQPDVKSSSAMLEPTPEPLPQQMPQSSRANAGTSSGAWARKLDAVISSDRFAWILFGLGMLVYLFTRLWKITQFPIYFFTDEATNPLFAQDLIAHGFRNAQGISLPLYFDVGGNRWRPLLSVYVHAVSMTLFGKSALVTRSTQAVVSILAPLAVALMLKYVFKSRFWWVGALLMAVAPAWFLHSRTGFEPLMMAAFFACFLLCYLLYRTQSPWYLFIALVFGGLTFYTYASGQMIMVAVGAVLAFSDLRYHLKQWRTTLPGLALIVLVALPALRFQAANPVAMTMTLRTMDSYWFHNITMAQKLEQFVRSWAHGLSPVYWFIPNEENLARHRMAGYGNLTVWLLPFFLIGFGWCLWRIKSPTHRALVLTTLVTPVGAALFENVGITRVMAFIVPACLLIALGLDVLLEQLGRRTRVRYWLMASALLVVFSAASIGMLRDALVNGPLWYRDYTLYGMQYGSTQLFGEAIPEYLRNHPDTQILVSPTWANGAENFIPFFLPEEQQGRVQLANVDHYMAARHDLTPNMLFVMTQDEYERAQASGKFKSVEVERTLPYPDGSPGFYFARLTYADDLDSILASESEERNRPVQDQVTIDGQVVQLTHSQLDMGAPLNLFDGDTFTLVRGLDANPLVMDFTFSEPRRITGLAADFAAMDFTLTAKLYPELGAEPKVYSQTYRGLPPDPHVDAVFSSAPDTVRRLRLEVLQLNAPADPHIHVRELKFAR
jgi:4-amino-4-deoxy-L-arabinose transferase-like glycosyltransferase/predicted DNA-binding antitoxin AbrB/MazE fold protein